MNEVRQDLGEPNYKQLAQGRGHIGISSAEP